MRAVLLLALVAICAVAVTAQNGNTVSPAPAVDTYTPAIMTPPSSSLKKPIIFDASASLPGAVDADAPLIGKPPANLKKSVVTEHIYGGVVEFAKGRTAGGCRCRKQLPEKFRYDTQFKRDYNATAVTPCGCPAKPAPKPEDALPPVVAALYPHRHRHNATRNATAPCAAPKPVVQKIAPSYYPHRKSARALAKEAAAAAAPCAKNATAAVPATITPSFYPAKHRRSRKGSKKERRAARKARRAARKAAKKARRAARKAAKKSD